MADGSSIEGLHLDVPLTSSTQFNDITEESSRFIIQVSEIYQKPRGLLINSGVGLQPHLLQSL